MPGPLAGVKVVEIAGLGPGPFAGMMLADHGAEVVRVERPGQVNGPYDSVLLRSRRIVQADLKTAEGAAVVVDLARGADILIEGFRPGVMERLGLGPDHLLGVNPRLVYGRMTGWGQDGPLAATAGHDINYIAVSGVLHGLGRAGDRPTPPINLLGDFGGGAMMLAFGVVSALLHARATGQGQVVDCAMTEGSALLSVMTWGMRNAGLWSDARGTNLLDTGAPFYDTYETADGGFVALGAIEPQFYAGLLQALELADDPLFASQMDPTAWPTQKARLEAVFRTRTRDDWVGRFEGRDVCFSPVLTPAEAATHPHNRARNAFTEVGGALQPGPAPRYSATPCDPPRPPVGG